MIKAKDKYEFYNKLKDILTYHYFQVDAYKEINFGINSFFIKII